MKRVFDFMVAAAGLVLLSPVLAACAVAVKLSSPGPALHRSVRAGLEGRPFTLYKFRTMRVEPGPGITQAGDPRVTRVGRFMRDWKLDELPQLWNVVRGDMSLVGPRPEDPRFVALYTPAQREILQVRPGITGPTAIAYRDEEVTLAGAADVEAAYVTQVLPQKLDLDLEYVRNQTFIGDLRALFRTLAAVLR